MARAENSPSQPPTLPPGSSDLVSPTADNKSEENESPSKFKHRAVEKSDPENKVSSDSTEKKQKKLTPDTSLHQRLAKQLPDQSSYDIETDEGGAYYIKTDNGSLKIHIAGLKHDPALESSKDRKPNLFEEQSQSNNTKSERELEWINFEKNMKTKTQKQLVKYFENSINKFTHIHSLISAAKLLKVDNATPSPLGLGAKQIKHLQDLARKKIENRLQGHLRSKKANPKEKLRAKHIENKIKAVNTFQKNHSREHTRYQKELQQAEIALKEMALQG